MRLRTGDRVRVDGGQGIVEILLFLKEEDQMTEMIRSCNELTAEGQSFAGSKEGHDPATGEWNDSLTGDFLWSNVNFGEAFPDVMTPLTWTVYKSFHQEIFPTPGNYSFSGNIGGRLYANISLMVSVFPAVGLNVQHALKQFGGWIGHLPEGIDIPLIPLLGLPMLFTMVPKMIKQIKKLMEAAKKMPAHLDANSGWCSGMRWQIQEVHTKAELVSLWHEGLKPYFLQSGWILAYGMQSLHNASIKLRRDLINLVGTADANVLLSNLSGSSELASLGPLIGLAQVARGGKSREAYLEQYGHRSPHEMELSIPNPAEDPDWLDRQLAEFTKSPVDVETLLAKKRAEFAAAWERFQERYPRKAKTMQRRIDRASLAACMREAARSEFLRVARIIRTFALRAGELTDLGDGIFFLTLNELLDVLSGDDAAMAYIPARRETHARYSALPPYPAIIRGRFDPFQWAADPNRRNDVYDAHDPVPAAASDTITGFAGAAGRVEGVVRRLDSPEEGDQLQSGEILVAATTNVGWTPLFPRAAAIVTDVGAPLSHAAIVARELGIPAVVGCVNATTRLCTGDRVRVDGAQGTIEILKAAD